MSGISQFAHAFKIAGATSLAVLAAGCATVSAPAPTEQLAVADAAIADAVSADAPTYDAADFRNAQRKLDRAHDELAQGDYGARARPRGGSRSRRAPCRDPRTIDEGRSRRRRSSSQHPRAARRDRAHAAMTEGVNHGPSQITWKAMAVALPAFAIGACAVLPERDAQVDDARAAVLAAQNDPQVVSFAPVELNQAVEAMRRTDAAWSNRGDIGEVHHLAYLAWTRASIATETARLKSAEASIASANAERDRVRLEARTREAAQAQRQAALAQRDAQRAQAQADANRQDALEAQRQAAAAAQQAQSAREQAEAARAQAGDAQARAQSLAAALQDLQARPTDRGMVVTLGDFLFDTGSAHLNPGGLRAVDHLVAVHGRVSAAAREHRRVHRQRRQCRCRIRNCPSGGRRPSASR